MMFHPVQTLLFLSDLWKQVQLKVLLQMTMSHVVKDEKSCEQFEKIPNKKKKEKCNSELLKDQRFAELFEHKDYLIDEQSEEYLATHPGKKNQATPIEEHFEPVDEDIDDYDASSASKDDASDEEGRARKKRGPRLYEVKDEHHADAFFFSF